MSARDEVQSGAQAQGARARGGLAKRRFALAALVVVSGAALGYCATFQGEVQAPTQAPAPAAHGAVRPPELMGSGAAVAGAAVPGVLGDGAAPDKAAAAPHAALPTPRHLNPYPPDELIGTWSEPYFPFLDDEPSDGSLSIGNSSHGHIINAKPLPLPGDTYAVLPRQSRRGLSYGSDEMIEIIQYAARRVAARHQRLMWVGNIGRQGGGDISYSVSHNSGRDADLAFCYTDAAGRPVDPPDLVPLNDRGVSVTHDGAYRFDTACTWTLVKALLNHPKIQVQYLFISRPLREKLLRHARRRGERASLIERAELALIQPGRSPHNDHLHLRLYCSRRDVLAGCVNTGHLMPGVDLFKNARRKRAREVALRLRDAKPEQRARAIERLVLFEAAHYVRDVAASLGDASPRVREAAAKALGHFRDQAYAQALVRTFQGEDQPSVQIAILDALRVMGGADAGAFLAQVLTDPRMDAVEAGALPERIKVAYTQPLVPEIFDPSTATWKDPTLRVPVDAPHYGGRPLDVSGRTYSVRLAAVEAAAQLERPEPVLPLMDLLGHNDPLMRGRAARALRRLTNHSVGVVWDDPALSAELLEQGRDAWRKWWERNGGRGREAWLVAGFRERGFQVKRLDAKSIWELVRAITSQEYVSYNAQRVLMRLSEHKPASLIWSKGDACWHWTRWFQRNRRQFRLKSSPPELAKFQR